MSEQKIINRFDETIYCGVILLTYLILNSFAEQSYYLSNIIYCLFSFNTFSGIILILIALILSNIPFQKRKIVLQITSLFCLSVLMYHTLKTYDSYRIEEIKKQKEVIESITDPVQRAELYKRVFGACCDVPQTQIIP